MRLFPWKRKTDCQLSAYLDGELDAGAAARLGEQLAFDPEYRRRLQAYAQVSERVRQALSPRQVSDSNAFAQRLMARLGEEERPRPRRRRLAPALLASLGLLTAGLALAGLRRRGLV